MKIETRSEQLHAHGAAFDVPAGPSLAPRTRPKNLAILRHAGLPEREVAHRFLLVLIAAYALADAHFVKIQLHQLPVLAARSAVLFDAEINRAVAGFVSHAPRHQFFN